MPYNPDNPPDVVKKLSPAKQRQWVDVWNSCFKKGQPESQCFSTAWGVVKKSSCDDVITGHSVSEGTVSDATINKDIIDGMTKDIIDGMIAAEVAAMRRKSSVVFPFPL